MRSRPRSRLDGLRQEFDAWEETTVSTGFPEHEATQSASRQRAGQGLSHALQRVPELGIPACLQVNNRAEGSAPRTIAAVAELWATRA